MDHLDEFDSDDITASIVSEAQRKAQSELRSTSEILKLAGVVLRDRSSSSSSSLALGGTNGIKTSTTNASVSSSSPRSTSPPVGTSSGLLGLGGGNLSDDEDTANHAIPEYSHLPGKFGSLSFTNSVELSNSPINRTQLLSKLDGLENSTAPRMLDRQTIGVGDVLAGVASARASMGSGSGSEVTNARTRSAVEEAMGNAVAASGRMKQRMARKHNGLVGVSGGSSDLLSASRISTMAMGEMETARLPKVSLSEMMPLWVKRKIEAETGGMQHGVSSASPVGSGNGSVKDDKGDSTKSSSTTKTTTKPAELFFGQYEMHPSDTIITHEFNRGDWTWTTEWSPDGKYLAMATENHDLSIVEAGMSTPVWKVIHDNRIGRLKNDTTHTIRAIAWGGTFIALGGTGDAVSIVESYTPSSSGTSSSNSASNTKKHSFRIVDIITETGFVGALSWQKNSNILAIGNREDQCLVVEVCRNKDGTVNSNILHNIERTDWVNAVRFSPGGTKLAIGDRSGLLSVYLFVVAEQGTPPALSTLQDITMEDNILDLQWSPDAKYIYAGGEDYCVSVIGTSKWDVLQKIGRDRWVPFLAPSRGGSYLVAGGESSQVSLLDVKNQWKEVTSLPVEDGTPLFARWHPKDQYFAISGQFNHVVVYETSCRRLMQDKCLRSKSSILAVEFSPNGKILAVGNETGIVTFFDAMSPAFVTLYETVIGSGGEMTLRWSPSGRNIAITSGSTFVLLDTVYSGKAGTHPQSNARFLVKKVIQGGVNFVSLSFSPKSEWLALTGEETTIIDVKHGCSSVRVLEQQNVLSSGWSPDGSVFAIVGKRDNLSIYYAKGSSPKDWELLFSISFSVTVLALCWGPSVNKGLQYLAFGGEHKKVTILEVRTLERTWETVLQIPCKSNVNDLDWNNRGMLCMGDDEGVVSIVDLSYLKSGRAVNEMNYNWQRQGVICTMKLTRNLGRNSITSLRWLQSTAVRNNRNLLAIGGSDGVVEIVDLSERQKLEASS